MNQTLKKLYEVEVVATVLVLATSEGAACDAAVDAVGEQDGGTELNGRGVRVLSEAGEIPQEWRGCIAYGDNAEELTCEQFLEESCPET